MNSDPWKHRGDNMRCKTCMWFVPKAPVSPPRPIVVAEEDLAALTKGPFESTLIAQELDKMTLAIKYVDRSYDLGRCRRHAPNVSGFPVVFVNDWCGDHRLDENKLRAE
jgi:hypothetical protein